MVRTVDVAEEEVGRRYGVSADVVAVVTGGGSLGVDGKPPGRGAKSPRSSALGP